jgi:hypothetical protein
MNTKSQKILLIFLLLIFFTITAPALSAEVVSISITSSDYDIGGFRGRSEFNIRKTPEGFKGKMDIIDPHFNFENLIKKGFLIEKKDPNYRGKSWVPNTKIITREELYKRLENDIKETSHNIIPEEKIERLLDAIHTEPVKTLDPSQFDINQEWLRKLAEDIVEKELDPSKKYYFIMKSRKSELIEGLSNLKRAYQKIRRHYAYGWSDDYADLETRITLSDGKMILITSKSQHDFMIPWKITVGSQEYTTYAVNISRALNNILPQKFTNKKRIKGDLINIFKDRMWSDEIRGWMDTAESEFKLRGQIDFIKNEFLIVKGRLNREYKKGEWELIEKGKWEVTLSHKEWPKNVFVSTDITYLSGHLKYDKFSPERVHSYIKKLFNIGWIRKYIEDHPYAMVFVNISHDRSIIAEDFKKEMERLEHNQNYEWQSTNLPYHEDIISFYAEDPVRGSSNWLIFPDKTVTLLNFHGEQVLNWNSKELSRWKKYSTHYSGARISPDGKIIHP